MENYAFTVELFTNWFAKHKPFETTIRVTDDARLIFDNGFVTEPITRISRMEFQKDFAAICNDNHRYIISISNRVYMPMMDELCKKLRAAMRNAA